MSIMWRYLDKRSATIAAIKDFNNMKFIIRDTGDEIRGVYESAAGLSSPKLDDMPKAHNPTAGEDRTIRAIEEIDLLRERYRQAVEYLNWFQPAWDALVRRSSGKIASLMALAQGKLPKEMLEDFCNPETGLFPKPREIHFDCSCPDGASCCKHVAATLYGIGARLDAQPELFFTLRGIDPNSIVSAEVVDALTGDASSELEGADLGDVFGIALDEENGGGDVAISGGSRSVAIVGRAVSTKPPIARANARPSVSDLAARVKVLRLKLGLSQSAFGKKIGTYQAVVSLMERGKGDSQILSHMPAIERLEKGN